MNVQPLWRHAPHLGDRLMLAYRASDVVLTWPASHSHGDMGAPITCGYVKEGKGKSLPRDTVAVVTLQSFQNLK